MLFGVVGLLQNDIAWFPVRFLIGVAINPLYILGEVWMIALAPEARRGRIMGIFNAVTGAGYAAGPLTLALVGSHGWPPLLVGMVGFTGCAVMLFATTSNLAGFEDDGERARRFWSFWTLAPALLVAVTVSAATQQSVYSLLPVFGAAYGLPQPTLAALISVMSLGNIFLQIPLGLLAERFGARAMIVACATLNMICALLLPFVITTPRRLAGAADHRWRRLRRLHDGADRTRQPFSRLGRWSPAMPPSALMWGVGGIIGPPGSGFAMQHFGAPGLPAVIAALSGVLVDLRDLPQPCPLAPGGLNFAAGAT